MRNEELEVRNEKLGVRNEGSGSKYQVAGSRYKSVSRSICLSLLSIMLGASLFAQETEQITQAVRISLDEAVKMAFENNLSLESSRIGLETKKRASDYSWNQFIPSITVAGAYSRDNSPSKVSGVAYIDPLSQSPITGPAMGSNVLIAPYSANGPQWTFAIPINVSLTLSMAMIENMNRLKHDYESGILSYENAKVQLERDVRKMYHNMLLLQENIDLLRGSFENVNRQVQMAQANYDAGLAPELTLIQARVARENMRPMMDQAENGLKLSKMQFAMSLGMDYETEFELVPANENTDFIAIDVNEMISKAAFEKPEVQELKKSIQMLESVRKAQWYSLFPALTVSWGTTPAYIGDPASRWADPAPGSLTISLGMRLHSLIPFSVDMQAIKALDDQIRTANIGLAQMINGTEIEIYNIVTSLERTRITAEAQAETVALAEQSYRLTEQAYQAGLQDYFQVQNAQQSLHQARVQMLEQQFNYLNGLIDLEYAIGVPFGTLSQRSN